MTIHTHVTAYRNYRAILVGRPWGPAADFIVIVKFHSADPLTVTVTAVRVVWARPLAGGPGLEPPATRPGGLRFKLKRLAHSSSSQAGS